MKKIIIILLVCPIAIISAYGQTPNCNNNSSNCENVNSVVTNPNNPVNPNCPELRNNFDWRIQNPWDDEEDYSVYGPNNQLFTIQNPFTGSANSNHDPYVTFGLNSNYQPEDGWELLKANGSIVFYEVHYFLSNPTTQTTKTLAL